MCTNYWIYKAFLRLQELSWKIPIFQLCKLKSSSIRNFIQTQAQIFNESSQKLKGPRSISQLSFLKQQIMKFLLHFSSSLFSCKNIFYSVKTSLANVVLTKRLFTLRMNLCGALERFLVNFKLWLLKMRTFANFVNSWNLDEELKQLFWWRNIFSWI